MFCNWCSDTHLRLYKIYIKYMYFYDKVAGEYIVLCGGIYLSLTAQSVIINTIIILYYRWENRSHIIVYQPASLCCLWKKNCDHDSIGNHYSVGQQVPTYVIRIIAIQIRSEYNDVLTCRIMVAPPHRLNRRSTHFRCRRTGF